MIDLKQFRQNATNDGLCSEYATKWDGCGSKKQLIDLAFGVKGVDYICDAIAKGWGISPSYICDNFSRYINGQYTYNDGYQSQMYCNYQGDILCQVELLALINCDVTIEVPEYHICQIYVTGNSRINLIGKGETIVVSYGKPEDIVVSSDGVKYKRICKKEKDKHEGQ